MTDFNYFDDWGLDGGWEFNQNPDYAPLWDSMNTGNTAQPSIFPQDDQYNMPDLQSGGDLPNYNYTGINIGNDGFNSQYQMPGYKPSPMFAQLGQATQSGGPMPTWMQAQNVPTEAYQPHEQNGMFDQITGAINKVGEFGQKNKDLLRLIMGGYGAFKDNQAADKKQALAAQMMAKFGNPNAAMYAAGHKNYYQNPGEWMNSPYVQVPYRQAADEYMRKMAAQGRTNPNEMAYTQAQMLNDMASKSYNNWMQTSYPWGQENANLISPYGDLMNQAQKLDYNKYNGVLEWLARMSGIPQQDLGLTQRKDGDKFSIQDLIELFSGMMKSQGQA